MLIRPVGEVWSSVKVSTTWRGQAVKATWQKMNKAAWQGRYYDLGRMTPSELWAAHLARSAINLYQLGAIASAILADHANVERKAA
jgi:hypothetical protein